MDATCSDVTVDGLNRLSVRNQNSFGCGYPAGQSSNPLDGARLRTCVSCRSLTDGHPSGSATDAPAGCSMVDAPLLWSPAHEWRPRGGSRYEEV
jgi:hypothetical protein